MWNFSEWLSKNVQGTAIASVHPSSHNYFLLIIRIRKMMYSIKLTFIAIAFAAIVGIPCVYSFGATRFRHPSFMQAQRTVSREAPKMVIFWSIMSSIDLAKYAVGASDSFQGTGVWSGIKFKREEEGTSAKDSKDATTASDYTDVTSVGSKKPSARQ